MADRNDEELRAGSRVLSLFINPLNVRILRAHADGPQRLADVRAATGWSAESTMRAAIASLSEAGALAKDRVPDATYGIATRLTDAGHDLLFVADVLEAWLRRCPAGPIAPDSEAAKGAVKALAGGWSSKLIRELANRPITLTELSQAIPEFSYPSLERRTNWMRITGQIEPVESRGRGTPYVVTDWLRQAIAPISASGRCERIHMGGDSGPITDVEVEAAFLLATPLVSLPATASGRCVLAVQLDPAQLQQAGGPKLVGVSVELKGGAVTSCVTDLGEKPGTWAVGSAEGWLNAVIDGRLEALRIGGSAPQLAADIASGLHVALFAED